MNNSHPQLSEISELLKDTDPTITLDNKKQWLISGSEFNTAENLSTARILIQKGLDEIFALAKLSMITDDPFQLEDVRSINNSGKVLLSEPKILTIIVDIQGYEQVIYKNGRVKKINPQSLIRPIMIIRKTDENVRRALDFVSAGFDECVIKYCILDVIREDLGYANKDPFKKSKIDENRHPWFEFTKYLEFQKNVCDYAILGNKSRHGYIMNKEKLSHQEIIQLIKDAKDFADNMFFIWLIEKCENHNLGHLLDISQ